MGEIGAQGGLVVFDRQEIVPPSRHDLLTYLALGLQSPAGT